LFAAWPLVGRNATGPLSSLRRWLLVAATLTAFMAPDFDGVAALLVGRPWRDFHNNWTHSLSFCLALSVPFGLICGLLAQGRYLFFAALGAAAALSHVVLDALTWGSGVMLLWPFTPQRFQSPILIFRGVRHSVGAPLSSHLLTVANDLAFALVVYLLSRWWWSRRSQPGPVSPRTLDLLDTAPFRRPR